MLQIRINHPKIANTTVKLSTIINVIRRLDMNRYKRNSHSSASENQYNKHIPMSRKQKIQSTICGIIEALTIFVFPAIGIAVAADSNNKSVRVSENIDIVDECWQNTGSDNMLREDSTLGVSGMDGAGNISGKEVTVDIGDVPGIVVSAGVAEITGIMDLSKISVCMQMCDTGIHIANSEIYENEMLAAEPVLAEPAQNGADENVSGEAISQSIEQSELPKQLLEMQDKYPETAQFVSEYAAKKDVAPAGTVGEVIKGEIPLLIQWDERWGYQEYGDFLIATDGCGPTSLSMVVVGLTGDASVTPYRVACYAQNNGYYESGAGSKWTLMTEGAAHFGVTGIELPLYKESVFDALEAGMPIICSVGAGDFTTSGHFIVLVGVSDGKIIVNDPNSKANSSKLWDYERLEEQIINLWVYVAQ